MKKNHMRARTGRAAFTLIELLVVIAIIAILASMTLAAISKAAVYAKKVKAKAEEADLVNAITSYESDYSRFPISANEQANAGTNDFTTGLIVNFGPGVGSANGYAATGYSYDNNSNVVAILMDMQTYPNGDLTCNTNHVKNPKQVKYLNAKMSGYNPPVAVPPPGLATPGVDNTGVYRDPWGNPYVITMDLSYDDHCSDYLYKLQAVSQNGSGSTAGFFGLANTIDPNGNGNNFLYSGKVMVWSAGPDGKYSNNSANDGNTAVGGVNKDNVVSWQ